MSGNPLSAEQLDVDDVDQAIELYYEGTDGDRLPGSLASPNDRETISRYAAQVADEVARILTVGPGASRTS